jgi:biopolymer transport protein ExbD
MIDVFLMLVIFLLISTSFVFQPGIMIRLPKSSLTDAADQQTATVIVTAQGEIYFDRLRTAAEDLENQMKLYPDKKILIIRADRSVNHGLVVEVMDHAKKAGFERLVIGTHPESSKDAGLSGT